MFGSENEIWGALDLGFDARPMVAVVVASLLISSALALVSRWADNRRRRRTDAMEAAFEAHRARGADGRSDTSSTGEDVTP